MAKQSKNSQASNNKFIYKGYPVSEAAFKDLVAKEKAREEAEKLKKEAKKSKSKEDVKSKSDFQDKSFDLTKEIQNKIAEAYKYFSSFWTKKVEKIPEYNCNTKTSDSNAEFKFCNGSKYGEMVKELKVISMPQFGDAKFKQNKSCLIEKFEGKANSCSGLKFSKGEVYFQLNNSKEGRFDTSELLKFVDRDTSPKDIALYSYDLLFSTRNSKEKNCEHNHELLAKYNIDEVEFVDFLVAHAS
jgi:hypothetical protein